MRINAEQLTRQIASHWPTGILLSGTDSFLVNEQLTLLKETAKKNGFEQIVRFTPNTASDWLEIKQECATRSLFDDKKIIDIQLKKATLDKASATHCTDALSSLTTDVQLMIITTAKLTAAQAKSAWINAFDSQGLVVTVWPVEHQQFLPWCKQRMARVGLSCSNEGLKRFTSHFEGNLAACAQEIEKLALAFPPGVISDESLMAALTQLSNYDVFQWIDATIGQQTERSQAMLQSLQAAGNEPILALWALTRDCRTLYQLSLMINEGSSFDAAANRLAIWQKRKPLFKRAVSAQSTQCFAQALRQSAAIDEMIKGERSGSPWLALSRLSLSLSQHTLKLTF